MITNVPKYLSPKAISHGIPYNRKKNGNNVNASKEQLNTLWHNHCKNSIKNKCL